MSILIREELIIVVAIGLALIIGIGIAMYLGKKDEALIDYAEPFEEDKVGNND